MSCSEKIIENLTSKNLHLEERIQKIQEVLSGVMRGYPGYKVIPRGNEGKSGVMRNIRGNEEYPG